MNVGALVNDGQFRMSAVRCYDTAMNQQNEKKCCSQSGAESVETPGVWVETTWREMWWWETKSGDAGKALTSDIHSVSNVNQIQLFMGCAKLVKRPIESTP